MAQSWSITWTGISFSPTTQGITLGGTLDVTATLEINGGNAINGDITNNLPNVSFASSPSDKISVTSPVPAIKDGNEYVATTTATAATAPTADIGNQAVITASVGETTSNGLTLTCTDTLAGVTLDPSATTAIVWRPQGYTVPSVTVQGSGGSDLTSFATISWKLDGSDLDDSGMTNNVISLSTAGEHTVTVTASYNNAEVSANITVYANEVTGITFTPSVIGVAKNDAKQLTVTIEHTNYGTVSITDALADPVLTGDNVATVTYTSKNASGTVYQYNVASGSTEGTATATFTLTGPYTTAGTVSGSVNITVAPPPTATGNGFGGWE